MGWRSELEDRVGVTRPRWSVRIGGYPNGWEYPVLVTNDHEAAIARYEHEWARRTRMTTVAIFDDNGEGEPLDPDRVRERLDEEART